MGYNSGAVSRRSPNTVRQPEQPQQFEPLVGAAEPVALQERRPPRESWRFIATCDTCGAAGDRSCCERGNESFRTGPTAQFFEGCGNYAPAILGQPGSLATPQPGCRRPFTIRCANPVGWRLPALIHDSEARLAEKRSEFVVCASAARWSWTKSRLSCSTGTSEELCSSARFARSYVPPQATARSYVPVPVSQENSAHVKQVPQNLLNAPRVARARRRSSSLADSSQVSVAPLRFPSPSGGA